jgi:uncharacterized protein with ParB-like and HNH nuclease domain
MKKILGEAKTVRGLLSNRKYSIDYYQRDYKWEEKQIHELVDDLTGKFLEDHEPTHDRGAVEAYGHYFLGSIVISHRDGRNFVIDGQQRLTSLTLLLIYLHNLQKGSSAAVKIDDLIYSERYAKKSFNIDVDERAKCMESLYDGQSFDPVGEPESVQRIVARYEDIEEQFPKELKGESLPFFVDWLVDNVHLVEITAYSDEDAYTIFETMNDRGLSLTPTEMLKGFLLANITDVAKRNAANLLWKERVRDLVAYDKESDADCVKAWLRGQYAQTIRERKRGAKPEDFDRIGSEFHRWIRDNEREIGLLNSAGFSKFIEREFGYFSRQYLRLMQASWEITSGLEEVYYNAEQGFTLQYPILLATLTPDDPQDVADHKMRLAATFLDILLVRRLWNFRAVDYNTMQYAAFLVMKEVRHKSPAELAHLLFNRLKEDDETFAGNDRFYLHGMNRKQIKRILARMTDFIETQSGHPSRYAEYTGGKGNAKYEVEHIWADKPERFVNEFSNEHDFAEHRNRVGGLLLLPKSFNASYGALTYEEKLPHYFGQNLLARSLHEDCYKHNPGFISFVQRSGLPFRPHQHFSKSDQEERQLLYRRIAEAVWDPSRLMASEMG